MIKIVAVAHDKKRLAFLYQTLLLINNDLTSETATIVMISSSGNCKAEDIMEMNEKNRTDFEFEFFDDTYFDFGGYSVGFEKIDSSVEGCIFINDTISNKHRSSHLMKLFSEKINKSLNFSMGGSILVGPYGKSEFSFSSGLMDEYVPTYLFYLNSSAFINLKNIYSKINIIKNCVDNGFDADTEFSVYRGFAGLHASQISSRFKDHDKMNRKLVTAIVERCISVDAKKDGIIWFCDLGMKNKMRILFQKKIGILLNR